MEASKKPGRPKKDEIRNSSIAVRLTPTERDALTEYRRRQPDLPSESEVLRGWMVQNLKRAGLL